MGFSFDDIGPWIEDKAVPWLEDRGWQVLEIATQTVLVGGAGPLAQILEYLPPGIIRAGANTMILATPSLLQGKDIGAAVLTGYIHAADRALDAWLSSRGGKEATQQAKDEGARFVDENITKPFQRLANDAGLTGELATVKTWATQAGVNIDLGAELQRRGLTPEQLSHRFGVTPLAAALAVNLGAGKYLYDVDWYEPLSGQPIADPASLQLLLQTARHRLASPDVIAELQRRYVRASGLPSSVGVPPSGTFGDRRTRPAWRGNAPDPADTFTANEAFAVYQTMKTAFGSDHPLTNGMRSLYELLVQREAEAMQARASAAQSSSDDPFRSVFANDGPLNEAELARSQGGLGEQILRAVVLTAPAWGVGWALGWRLP